MLKLTIAASLSILSLLSISNIADARDRSTPTLTRHVPSSSQFSLINKQSELKNIDIPKSDIKGIHQSISEYCAKRNKIAENLVGKSTRFYEVKSLKIVNFLETEAQIHIEESFEIYDKTLVSIKPRQWIFKKDTSFAGTGIYRINLEKFQGKWRISKVIHG